MPVSGSNDRQKVGVSLSFALVFYIKKGRLTLKLNEQQRSWQGNEAQVS